MMHRVSSGRMEVKPGTEYVVLRALPQQMDQVVDAHMQHEEVAESVIQHMHSDLSERHMTSLHAWVKYIVLNARCTWGVCRRTLYSATPSSQGALPVCCGERLARRKEWLLQCAPARTTLKRIVKQAIGLVWGFGTGCKVSIRFLEQVVSRGLGRSRTTSVLVEGWCVVASVLSSCRGWEDSSEGNVGGLGNSVVLLTDSVLTLCIELRTSHSIAARFCSNSCSTAIGTLYLEPTPTVWHSIV
eukprot:244979-Amphidinium_carterae.1